MHNSNTVADEDGLSLVTYRHGEECVLSTNFSKRVADEDGVSLLTYRFGRECDLSTNSFTSIIDDLIGGVDFYDGIHNSNREGVLFIADFQKNVGDDPTNIGSIVLNEHDLENRSRTTTVNEYSTLVDTTLPPIVEYQYLRTVRAPPGKLSIIMGKCTTFH